MLTTFGPVNRMARARPAAGWTACNNTVRCFRTDYLCRVYRPVLQRDPEEVTASTRATLSQSMEMVPSHSRD